MSFNTADNVDFFLANQGTTNFKQLEPAVYLLSFNPKIGYYLSKTKDFTLPSKIYGHNSKNAIRILDHFVNTPNRVSGALLKGIKGSGKSLTAKEICILGAQQGIPTIVINDAHSGTDFNSFMAAIEQSCIVFIDEFEKTYEDRNEMNSMLSFLDGTVTSHKLVVATVNSAGSDNFEFLVNRPGRFYYHIEYGNVSIDIIREYCEDHLKYPERVSEIIGIVNNFKVFTLDMLTALVKEINKTGESLPEVLKVINIKPDLSLRDFNFVYKDMMFKGLDIGQYLSFNFLSGQSLAWVMSDDYRFDLSFNLTKEVYLANKKLWTEFADFLECNTRYLEMLEDNEKEGASHLLNERLNPQKMTYEIDTVNRAIHFKHRQEDFKFTVQISSISKSEEGDIYL